MLPVRDDEHGALFRPVKNNTAGHLEEAITPDGRLLGRARL
jgi:hypothetical protein